MEMVSRGGEQGVAEDAAASWEGSQHHCDVQSLSATATGTIAADLSHAIRLLIGFVYLRNETNLEPGEVRPEHGVLAVQQAADRCGAWPARGHGSGWCRVTPDIRSALVGRMT